MKPIPNKISTFKGANIWKSLKPSDDKNMKSMAVSAKVGSPSSTGLTRPSLKTPVLYWLQRAEKKVAIIKIKTTGIITLKSRTLIISKNCNVNMKEHRESTP